MFSFQLRLLLQGVPMQQVTIATMIDYGPFKKT